MPQSFGPIASEKTYGDGTHVVTYVSGMMEQMNPDGTTIRQFADGSVQQIQPDGTMIHKMKDGTLRQVQPDGNTIEQRPDGSRFEKHPAGNIVMLHADGTRIVVSADGETRTATDVDGNERDIAPSDPLIVEMTSWGAILDNDGALHKGHAAEAEEAALAAVAAGTAEGGNSFDLDGDGHLDDGEVKAMMSADSPPALPTKPKPSKKNSMAPPRSLPPTTVHADAKPPTAPKKKSTLPAGAPPAGQPRRGKPSGPKPKPKPSGAKPKPKPSGAKPKPKSAERDSLGPPGPGKPLAAKPKPKPKPKKTGGKRPSARPSDPGPPAAAAAAPAAAPAEPEPEKKALVPVAPASAPPAEKKKKKKRNSTKPSATTTPVKDPGPPARKKKSGRNSLTMAKALGTARVLHKVKAKAKTSKAMGRQAAMLGVVRKSTAAKEPVAPPTPPPVLVKKKKKKRRSTKPAVVTAAKAPVAPPTPPPELAKKKKKKKKKLAPPVEKAAAAPAAAPAAKKLTWKQKQDAKKAAEAAATTTVATPGSKKKKKMSLSGFKKKEKRAKQIETAPAPTPAPAPARRISKLKKKKKKSIVAVPASEPEPAPAEARRMSKLKKTKKKKKTSIVAVEEKAPEPEPEHTPEPAVRGKTTSSSLSSIEEIEEEVPAAAVAAPRRPRLSSVAGEGPPPMFDSEDADYEMSEAEESVAEVPASKPAAAAATPPAVEAESPAIAAPEPQPELESKREPEQEVETTKPDRKREEPKVLQPEQQSWTEATAPARAVEAVADPTVVAFGGLYESRRAGRPRAPLSAGLRREAAASSSTDPARPPGISAGLRSMSRTAAYSSSAGSPNRSSWRIQVLEAEAERGRFAQRAADAAMRPASAAAPTTARGGDWSYVTSLQTSPKPTGLSGTLKAAQPRDFEREAAEWAQQAYRSRSGPREATPLRAASRIASLSPDDRASSRLRSDPFAEAMERLGMQDITPVQLARVKAHYALTQQKKLESPQVDARAEAGVPVPSPLEQRAAPEKYVEWPAGLFVPSPERTLPRSVPTPLVKPSQSPNSEGTLDRPLSPPPGLVAVLPPSLNFNGSFAEYSRRFGNASSLARVASPPKTSSLQLVEVTATTTQLPVVASSPVKIIANEVQMLLMSQQALGKTINAQASVLNAQQQQMLTLVRTHQRELVEAGLNGEALAEQFDSMAQQMRALSSV